MTVMIDAEDDDDDDVVAVVVVGISLFNISLLFLT